MALMVQAKETPGQPEKLEGGMDALEDEAECLSELDNAVSELKINMSIQCDHQNALRNCARCNKTVEKDEYLTVQGKVYHYGCLSCAKCSLQFGADTPFIPKNGEFYCEECHLESFGKKCAGCNEYIKDQIVSALMRHWHIDCFACTHCKEPFAKNGGRYMVNDDKPYCPTHYKELFAERCAACNEVIEGPAIKADGLLYHTTCLTCETCKKPFEAGKYYLSNGKRYCEEHLPRTVRPKCAKCNESITGMYYRLKGDITVHFDCHVCEMCQVKLEDEYTEVDGKSYCAACGNKAVKLPFNSQPAMQPAALNKYSSTTTVTSRVNKTDVPAPQNDADHTDRDPAVGARSALSDHERNRDVPEPNVTAAGPELNGTKDARPSHEKLSKELTTEDSTRSIESVILEQRNERLSRQNSVRKSANSVSSIRSEVDSIIKSASVL